MKAQRFDTLDAMRGVAAMLVIPRHTGIFGPAIPESHSYLAVDLFFVLSGFVIAHAYDQKLLSGAMSVGRFMLVRMIRLYPLYLLAAALAIAVALTHSGVDPNVMAQFSATDPGVVPLLLTFAASLVYLPWHLGDARMLFPLNAAIWSLMFELIVNLLYAVARPWLSTRALLALIGVSAVALILAALRFNGLDYGWFWGMTSLGVGLLRAVLGFSIGLMIHRMHQSGVARAPSVGATTLMALVILPLLMPAGGALNGLIDAVAILVVFPLGVLLGAQSFASGRTLRAFLVLGTVSYPFYVLHVPMLLMLERGYLHLTGLRLDTHEPFAGIAFLLALTLVSLALDRAFDAPLRKRATAALNRLLGPLPTPAAAPAAAATPGVAAAPGAIPGAADGIAPTAAAAADDGREHAQHGRIRPA